MVLCQQKLVNEGTVDMNVAALSINGRCTWSE
jgi:hypothetical protein